MERIFQGGDSKKTKIKDIDGFPHQGAVPIIMGGLSERDYSKLAPPNSYLHVDQFEGPEHLAAKVPCKP